MPKPEPTVAERILDAVDGCDGVIVDRTYRRFFAWRGAQVQGFDANTGLSWDAPWPIDPEAVAALGRDAVRAAIAERILQGF